MKLDPPRFVSDLGAILERRLIGCVAGSLTWAPAISLGSLTKAALESGFATVPMRVDAWRAWASAAEVELVLENRVALSSRHVLPTHVLIPDLETAARVCAGPWPQTLARARERAQVLTGRFAHLDDPTAVAAALRSVMKLEDVDFELVCAAATWFANAQDTSALTPRQIPLEGVHAKWLQSHTRPVRLLANLPELTLAARHPSRVHLSYLDPTHLGAGGRRFDAVTLGDRVDLPYVPRVVVISENKDTAVHFPPVPGGVALEGEGSAVSTFGQLPWAVNAPVLVYWGDIDAEGFEILDQLRASGMPVRSMLMDRLTYERYERFGTNVDKAGKPLLARAPKLVPHLTDAERELYVALCDVRLAGHRRIEQERIPLGVAVAHLEGLR